MTRNQPDPNDPLTVANALLAKVCFEGMSVEEAMKLYDAWTESLDKPKH